jgi:hypothetical protein
LDANLDAETDEEYVIAAGYMAKVVIPKPDWITSAAVVRICSVSNCVSRAFCDYINHWKHNGYWFFNSPADIQSICDSDEKAAKQFEVFYYEIYEEQFDEESASWCPFLPETSFATHVQLPKQKELLGYDVVTYSVQTSPECSPLSCNNLAEKFAVNESCLLLSFSEAKHLIETGSFGNSEPGPFRILAVYRPREI